MGKIIFVISSSQKLEQKIWFSEQNYMPLKIEFFGSNFW
jgi:hypothetical protein